MKIEEMQQNAKEAAEVLKTMAHPDRLLVLCQLTQGEMGAGALQEKSSLSQSAFSQHLSVLRKSGMVKTRKDAQQVFYSLNEPRVATLLQAMHVAFCR